MTDYISREALKQAFEDDGHLSAYVEEMIDDIPAADVREVVRGKWLYRGQRVIDDLFPTYACSACGRVINADLRTRCIFCPNCGADTRGEQT